MDLRDICMGCCTALQGADVCPVCGTRADTRQPAGFLPLRTELWNGSFAVGRVLVRGGDGCTYLGFDLQESKAVLLREFFPESIARRSPTQCDIEIMQGCEAAWRDCKQNFLELWRKLRNLQALTALPSVSLVFEENETAYAVYDYQESVSLRDFLLSGSTGNIQWERARGLLMPVLSALQTLHAQGILHRGLSPQNLEYGKDGKLRISGFSIWQARTAGGELTADLQDGYAALEQYAPDGAQGSWTDIYAFAAVLYRCLIGSDPENAQARRQNDRLMVPARFAEKLPAYVINALINALQILPEERTRTVEQFRAELSAAPSAAYAHRIASAAKRVPTGVERSGDEEKTVFFSKEQVQQGLSAQDLKEKKKKKRSPGMIVLSTTIAIVLAGIVGFSLFIIANPDYRADISASFRLWLAGGTERDPTDIARIETSDAARRIPNLVGRAYEPALLTEYLDQFTIVVEEQNDEQVPKGTIISQSPAGGATANLGDTVRVVVSKGKPGLKLPKIKGEKIQNVQLSLEESGFVLSINTNQNDGTHTPGEITYVYPLEGGEYPVGSTIFITIWGNPDGSPVVPTTAAQESADPSF